MFHGKEKAEEEERLLLPLFGEEKSKGGEFFLTLSQAEKILEEELWSQCVKEEWLKELVKRGQKGVKEKEKEKAEGEKILLSHSAMLFWVQLEKLVLKEIGKACEGKNHFFCIVGEKKKWKKFLKRWRKCLAKEEWKELRKEEIEIPARWLEKELEGKKHGKNLWMEVAYEWLHPSGEGIFSEEEKEEAVSGLEVLLQWQKGVVRIFAVEILEVYLKTMGWKWKEAEQIQSHRVFLRQEEKWPRKRMEKEEVRRWAKTWTEDYAAIHGVEESWKTFLKQSSKERRKQLLEVWKMRWPREIRERMVELEELQDKGAMKRFRKAKQGDEKIVKLWKKVVRRLEKVYLTVFSSGSVSEVAVKAEERNGESEKRGKAICANCGRRGHNFWECGEQARCWKCGEGGHKKQKCEATEEKRKAWRVEKEKRKAEGVSVPARDF